MSNDAPHKSHQRAAAKLQHCGGAQQAEVGKSKADALAAAEAFFALWQTSLQTAAKPVSVSPRRSS